MPGGLIRVKKCMEDKEKIKKLIFNPKLREINGITEDQFRTLLRRYFVRSRINVS
jgi:hypothetical protein